MQKQTDYSRKGMEMRHDQYALAEGHPPGGVPASRSELQALLEAFDTLFSPSFIKEPQVQALVVHLQQSIEQALAASPKRSTPVVISMTRDELFMLALATAAMIVPYRAGMPVSPKEQRLYRILAPLVERLFAQVQQIRHGEFQALLQGREYA